VVAIQYYEKGTSGGREEDEALFREGIGIQQPAALALVADQILRSLV
jgi:hypothetical protein